VERKQLEKQPIFCGIYINSNEARLSRPVKHLASKLTEYISPFEQLLMSIACLETDLRDDTTHMEYSP
jgi:DNA-directed RNA polymerase I subunit RPA2